MSRRFLTLLLTLCSAAACGPLSAPATPGTSLPNAPGTTAPPSSMSPSSGPSATPSLPTPTSAPSPTPPGPSLSQLIGQKLMVAMSGTTPSADLLGRVRRGEVGGVILFGANIE